MLQTRHRLLPALGIFLTSMVAAIAVAAPARADNTVVYDAAGPGATSIGLIGDSTLSGVRWYAEYGELQRYNFIFDAESCRRTIERSCWSREQFRSENALTTLQRLSGQWGQVLVIMSGYNDSHSVFGDAVDTMVAEAQRQGIPKVVWLTLRTADVDYEEPLHQANGNTYREANRTLYEKAAAHGGYLQVADWATHSEGQSDWFEYDGVHLTIDGVEGVTTYVADQVGRVLNGETITPANPPWVTLSSGDSGRSIALAQEALLNAGYTSVGGADGVFGSQTVTAVSEFQVANGLPDTGEVDAATAAGLGLHVLPAVVAEPVSDVAIAAPVAEPAPAAATMVEPPTDEGVSPVLVMLLILAAGGVCYAVLRWNAPRTATRHPGAVRHARPPATTARHAPARTTPRPHRPSGGQATGLYDQELDMTRQHSR